MMGNEMGNNNTSGLKDEDNTPVEVSKKSVVETTHASDIKEENETEPAGEGKDFHEKVTNLASDDPERIGDPCADYQTSNEQEATEVHSLDESLKVAPESNERQEPTEVHPRDESLKVTLESNERLEDTEVHPLDESLRATLESNGPGEEDERIQQAISVTDDSGHEKPIERKMEETDLQEKQASLKKEEEGTKFISHDPEPRESTHSDLSQHELATVHADEQSVEDGSGSLQGSEKSLGSSLSSDVEVNGHLSDTEASENMDGSVDLNTDLVMEKKRDGLLPEQKASEEQLDSSEEKFETTDEDKVESGLSTITTIASNGLSGLGNESDGEFPTEMNLVRNDCSKLESEAISVSSSPNSHLEVPEPEDKCIILKEETRLMEKESENGENKHDDIPIQSCGESMVESEPFKSSEPQFDDAKIEPMHKDNEKVSVFNPLSDRDCQTEETKVSNNQNEASEDHFLDSEEKFEVVPELRMVQTELTMPHCNHKEEESTEKKYVQENGDNAEPLSETGIGGTDTAEQSLCPQLPVDQAEALPPQAVFGFETVQSNNDSILFSKQENCGELFATEASTTDCTNWIAEALASMDKLALDMPGQHVSQHTEAIQAAETKISANQSSEQCEKFETSPSINGGSETQESVGRSSTESDADNLIVHARIQKSPSFSLDLQNEARTEESDCTPLLYHDKAAVEGSTNQGDDDVSFVNLVEYTGYEQDLSQYQAMPVEEKVSTLEKCDSEKSKTPFLRFLKEEEEAHIVVEPQQHENHSATENSTKNLLDSHTKEAAPTTSSKGKEKRRHRSSLFTNCMCCATVTN